MYHQNTEKYNVLDVFLVNSLILPTDTALGELRYLYDVTYYIRHKNQIHKAIEAIEKAEEILEQEMPIDLISVPIKQSLEELSAITGENVSEDIIAEIFSKFCLGK